MILVGSVRCRPWEIMLRKISWPPLRRSTLWLAAVLATMVPFWKGGCLRAAQNEETPPKKGIFGWVKSGDIPLPGVSVSAANPATGQQAVTSTDENGSYALFVPSIGKYKVNAILAAFGPATQEVTID